MELSERKAYKYVPRESAQSNISKKRYGLVIYLALFQLIFIINFYFFGNYAPNGSGKYENSYSEHDQVPKFYASKHLTLILTDT